MKKASNPSPALRLDVDWIGSDWLTDWLSKISRNSYWPPTKLSIRHRHRIYHKSVQSGQIKLEKYDDISHERNINWYCEVSLTKSGENQPSSFRDNRLASVGGNSNFLWPRRLQSAEWRVKSEQWRVQCLCSALTRLPPVTRPSKIRSLLTLHHPTHDRTGVGKCAPDFAPAFALALALDLAFALALAQEFVPYILHPSLIFRSTWNKRSPSSLE